MNEANFEFSFCDVFPYDVSDEGYGLPTEAFDAQDIFPFDISDQYLLSSEPLSRFNSSDGSSFGSSDSYASPSPIYITSLTNTETFNPTIDPALTYQPFPPELYTPPESVPRTIPSPQQSSPQAYATPPQNTRDYPLICLSPNCNARPFRRRADLERHYRHRHFPATTLNSYPCDYPRCTRSQDPFHRRDHFRDHLREFHREDIEKRGVIVGAEWYEGRNTARGWWRCGKCLQRVSVDRCGFECPRCKSACCARRQEVRRRKIAGVKGDGSEDVTLEVP